MPSEVDIKALAADLAKLKAQYIPRAGVEDLEHLERMRGWANLCTGLGYATAWVCPNPLSAALLSTGTFARWTVLAHPICHRALDKVAEAKPHLHSKRYARGTRRFVDWLDWLYPDAWHEEHNILHHYRLNEDSDPDLVERNLEWLRDAKMPDAVKTALVGLLAAVWKPLYYAPNSLKELRLAQARRAHKDPPDESLRSWRLYVPWTPEGRALWTKSWLPYAGAKFVVTPLLFAPLGPLAVANVVANTAMAEVLTNLHSFLVIVPNHAGEDMVRFDEPIEARDEFFYRQIVGSANFRTGGDLNDFLHGWLNYQIEHHLWPEASPLQCRKVQPHVKAVCAEHGVPYVQESVFTRLRKTVDVMIGKATMLRASRSGVVPSSKARSA